MALSGDTAESKETILGLASPRRFSKSLVFYIKKWYACELYAESNETMFRLAWLRRCFFFKKISQQKGHTYERISQYLSSEEKLYVFLNSYTYLGFYVIQRELHI